MQTFKEFLNENSNKPVFKNGYLNSVWKTYESILASIERFRTDERDPGRFLEDAYNDAEHASSWIGGTEYYGNAWNNGLIDDKELEELWDYSITKSLSYAKRNWKREPDVVEKKIKIVLSSREELIKLLKKIDTKGDKPRAEMEEWAKKNAHRVKIVEDIEKEYGGNKWTKLGTHKYKIKDYSVHSFGDGTNISHTTLYKIFQVGRDESYIMFRLKERGFFILSKSTIEKLEKGKDYYSYLEDVQNELAGVLITLE